MSDLFSVKDKCVVVTGGAGVLCGGIAEDLADAGAKVCIADYDDKRANSLADQNQCAGQNRGCGCLSLCSR